MEWLLAWYNLVFLIALAFGMIFALAQASGLLGGEGVDHDVGHDVGHDVHHDIGHDAHHGGHYHGGEHDTHQSIASLAATLLGIGRIPLMLIVMAFMMLFGVVGLCLNVVLEVEGGAFAILSFAGASAAAVFGTGAVARIMARVMPKFESYDIRRSDLLGLTGVTITSVDGSSGFLQVNDHEGNLKQHACRTEGEALSTGASVLLVSYDDEQDRYLVRRDVDVAA